MPESPAISIIVDMLTLGLKVDQEFVTEHW